MATATLTTQGTTIAQAVEQLDAPTIAALAWELECEEWEYEIYESDPTGGTISRYA